MFFFLKWTFYSAFALLFHMQNVPFQIFLLCFCCNIVDSVYITFKKKGDKILCTFLQTVEWDPHGVEWGHGIALLVVLFLK